MSAANVEAFAFKYLQMIAPAQCLMITMIAIMARLIKVFRIDVDSRRRWRGRKMFLSLQHVGRWELIMMRKLIIAEGNLLDYYSNAK